MEHVADRYTASAEESNKKELTLAFAVSAAAFLRRVLSKTHLHEMLMGKYKY